VEYQGGIELPPSEYFFEQRGRLRGGVFANLGLFDCEHVEDAVEGFLDDVLVEVEFVGDGSAAGGVFDYVFVLLDDAYVLKGTVHDRGECGGEIGGAGAAEIIRGGGVVAGEDLARVVKSHLSQGSYEDRFRLGRGLLGGAIHADFEIVDLISHAEHPHAFADGLKLGRKQDADGFVPEESVVPAGQSYGFGCAHFERFFQSSNDFFVAKAKLGLSDCGTANGQRDDEQGRAQEIPHRKK
jgi:hypothetical protein